MGAGKGEGLGHHAHQQGHSHLAPARSTPQNAPQLLPLPPSSHPLGAAPPKGIGAGSGVGPRSLPRPRSGCRSGTSPAPCACRGPCSASGCWRGRPGLPGHARVGSWPPACTSTASTMPAAPTASEGTSAATAGTMAAPCPTSTPSATATSSATALSPTAALTSGSTAWASRPPSPKSKVRRPPPHTHPCSSGCVLGCPTRVPDVLCNASVAVELCRTPPQSCRNPCELCGLGLGSLQGGWSSAQPESCSSPWGRKAEGQRWGTHLRAEPGRMVLGCPGHVWGTGTPALTSPGWQPRRAGASRGCPCRAAQGSLSSPRGAEPAPGISGPFIPAPPGCACEAGCAGQPQA